MWIRVKIINIYNIVLTGDMLCVSLSNLMIFF